MRRGERNSGSREEVGMERFSRNHSKRTQQRPLERSGRQHQQERSAPVYRPSTNRRTGCKSRDTRTSILIPASYRETLETRIINRWYSVPAGEVNGHLLRSNVRILCDRRRPLCNGQGRRLSLMCCSGYACSQSVNLAVPTVPFLCKRTRLVTDPDQQAPGAHRWRVQPSMWIN
jgi:hypothetical protein